MIQISAAELLKSEQVAEELYNTTDDCHEWKQERITQVGVLSSQPLLKQEFFIFQSYWNISM